jgi:hypothetical protein
MNSSLGDAHSATESDHLSLSPGGATKNSGPGAYNAALLRLQLLELAVLEFVQDDVQPSNVALRVICQWTNHGLDGRAAM